MVNFPGRNGRRRRVLNDEVLSASSTRVALHVPADEPHSLPPRYSDAAGVENHAQITDFVPRRYRSIAALIGTGLATTVALTTMHAAAPSLATTLGAERLPTFELASPGSLATWISAVVLFVCSVACLLVYSIRRYKINDIRGRYRIWIAAGAACFFLSVNSVTGLHHVVSQALGHATGWSALRAGAVWWLGLAGLPLAWIAIRSLLDVKECRLAAALMIAAIGCYGSAVVSYLGLVPTMEPKIQTMAHGALTLGAHWLLLASLVSYARFIVLDAQGLIAHPQPSREATAKKPKRGSEKSTPEAADTSATTSSPAQKRPAQPQIKPAETPASLKSWVDGRRRERDRYEDDTDAEEEDEDSSKLSKSDRKRLRKLKAQNRAA